MVCGCIQALEHKRCCRGARSYFVHALIELTHPGHTGQCNSIPADKLVAGCLHDCGHARRNVDDASGVEDRPRDGDARGDREELAELDEEKEALQGQLGQNTARIRTLIEELPTRIISIERLQILRLTLQNIALQVQRKERELQMATVRRVLLRDDEADVPAPSPLLVQALSQVEALVGADRMLPNTGA